MLAQARTQSSQRVQRSMSINMVAVPLTYRFCTRNSTKSGLIRVVSMTGRFVSESRPVPWDERFRPVFSNSSVSISFVGTIMTVAMPIARNEFLSGLGLLSSQPSTISSRP